MQIQIASKGIAGFRTICSVHLPSGASMEGKGEAQEAYPASDEALEHIEKRLRRYKRRLKDHSQRAKAKEAGVVVFNNARHGGLNVVFKRADGHIGWIDPKSS